MAGTTTAGGETLTDGRATVLFLHSVDAVSVSSQHVGGNMHERCLFDTLGAAGTILKSTRLSMQKEDREYRHVAKLHD